MWKTTKEAGTKLRAKMTQMAWVRLMPIWRLRKKAQWSFQQVNTYISSLSSWTLV